MEPNVPLLRKVWEYVKDEPDDYDQREWVKQQHLGTTCGTTYCFAGHALALSGHTLEARYSYGTYAPEYYLDGERVVDVNIAAEACKALGISYTMGDRLFWGSNTREDVRRIVSGIIGEELFL